MPAEKIRGLGVWVAEVYSCRIDGEPDAGAARKTKLGASGDAQPLASYGWRDGIVERTLHVLQREHRKLPEQRTGRQL